MKKAFTLIELLVVISIIALLIAILLPALSAARRSAIRVQCATNEQQFGVSFAAWATDNRGLLPRAGGFQGHWPWDVGGDLIQSMFDYGADREYYFCPTNPMANEDGLWTDPAVSFNGINVIVGYNWMLYRPSAAEIPGAVGDLSGGPASVLVDGDRTRWVKDLETPRDGEGTSGTEVLTDIQYFVSSRWIDFGFNNLGNSSHVDDDGAPSGGNILYQDGHVSWKDFGESEHIVNMSGSFGQAHY